MLPASDIDVGVVSAKPLPEELPQLETIHRRYGNRVNVIRLRQRAGRGLRERVRIEGKSLPLSPVEEVWSVDGWPTEPKSTTRRC